MNTAIDIINNIKKIKGIESDYAVAQLLGIGRSAMTKYKHGGTMDDATALKASELLGIDPLPLIAEMNAQRTKSPELRKMWKKYAGSSAASIVLASMLFVSSPGDSHAAGMSESKLNPIYIMRTFIKWLMSFIRPLNPSILAI